MDLLERIDQWARKSPERIVHVSGRSVLTWGELKSKSDRLAAHLRGAIPQDRSPVAITGHKEPEMLIGFLGALKAGHPYLPIDSSVPEQRASRIITQAGAGLALGVQQINALTSGPAGAFEPEPFPMDAPVYILFTSGSTGEPKGVEITAACLTHFADWFIDQQKFDPQTEVFLNQAPFSFDLSVADLYGALLTGGTLFSVSATEASDPEVMRKVLEKSNITVWISTPSFARMCAFSADFSQAVLPMLRKFWFCGETLPPPLAAELISRFPDAELWNAYGPTEATVAMADLRIDAALAGSSEPLPVGRVMPGTRVLIRDDLGRELPAGAAGEIVIVGPNVSPGYIGRPDLTRLAFSILDGERAYRTGDIGRMRNGMLYCDGRRDGQVKIRGFRIELGEIDATLREHPSVREAVTAMLDGEGGPVLSAFVVPAAPVDEQELRDFLAELLPAYMIPASITTLDVLPLTLNGKLDRARLPAARPASRFPAIPAADPAQMRLVEMWERILGVSPIGIDDNFFELGGHSLRAAEFMAQVEKSHGRKVPLAQLFKAPTIRQFSRVLAGIQPDANWPIIEGIRTSGSRPPFICVPGFLDLARHLGPEQPCYGIHLAALESMPDTETAVYDLARKCVRGIRETFTEGPYYIAGHSFGGVVAFEIARQLREQGAQVSGLILIDPDPPQPAPADAVGRHLNRYLFQISRLFRMPAADRSAYLKQRMRIGLSRVGSLLHRLLGGSRGGQFNEAARGYHAAEIDAPITMFLARDTHLRSGSAYDPRMEWRRLARAGFDVQELPGDHYTLIREPNVARLARSIAELPISQATESATGVDAMARA